MLSGLDSSARRVYDEPMTNHNNTSRPSLLDIAAARQDAALEGVPAEFHQAVRQDAVYMQNHVGGRYSDCLASSAHAFLARGIAGLASPCAIAMAEAV